MSDVTYSWIAEPIAIDWNRMPFTVLVNGKPASTLTEVAALLEVYKYLPKTKARK